MLHQVGVSFDFWKEEVERDLQVLGVRRWRELVADREKMEGHFSTGQSPQWAVVLMEGVEEEEEKSEEEEEEEQEVEDDEDLYHVTC